MQPCHLNQILSVRLVRKWSGYAKYIIATWQSELYEILDVFILWYGVCCLLLVVKAAELLCSTCSNICLLPTAVIKCTVIDDYLSNNLTVSKYLSSSHYCIIDIKVYGKKKKREKRNIMIYCVAWYGLKKKSCYYCLLYTWINAFLKQSNTVAIVKVEEYSAELFLGVHLGYKPVTDSVLVYIDMFFQSNPEGLHSQMKCKCEL